MKKDALKVDINEGYDAYKSGDLKKAETLFRKVLQILPNLPALNHTLGILLIDLHRSYEGIPFLKAALDADKKTEQFWLSYIDALIKIDKLESACKFITLAKKAGCSPINLDKLYKRTRTPRQQYDMGLYFQAQDNDYLEFLSVLHEKVYDGYFEIGTRTGSSLTLSQSPSIAIDPFFLLESNPVGNKDFCLMFQETSDSFFQNSMPKLSGIKCQLAFIDGMHLFEYALKEFINLFEVSSEQALFLFHDPIPWTFEMATRNYKSIQRHQAWTGDIWKLVPILIEAGMRDHLSILTASPSGLLAIFSPKQQMVENLKNNYDKICSKWRDVEFTEDNLLKFYESGVFIKPEAYLNYLNQISFGERKTLSREYITG